MSSQPHKVAFYADLFYDSVHSPAYWIPPADLDVDAIILGGDIHYTPRLLGQLVQSIRETQPPTAAIIVVPGNGEYVRLELGRSRREYRSAVEAVPGAVFLDDEAIELPTGLTVIGSTLWSHVPDAEMGRYNEMLADEGMKGVDDIMLGDRFLTLHDTNELHRQARSYLEGQLRGLSRAEREETIVCTHYWPTLRPWEAEPETEPWYHMVGTDLDAMIAECGPRLWLCGHAHTSHHVTIATTRISSNPRAGEGPGNVNPDFMESFLLEL